MLEFAAHVIHQLYAVHINITQLLQFSMFMFSS